MNILKKILTTSLICLISCSLVVVNVSAEPEESTESLAPEQSYELPSEEPESSVPEEPQSQPEEPEPPESSAPEEPTSQPEEPEPSQPEEPDPSEDPSQYEESSSEPEPSQESRYEESSESEEPSQQESSEVVSEPEQSSTQESVPADPKLKRDPFEWLSGIKTVIPADRSGYVSPAQKAENEKAQKLYEESRAALETANKADKHILSTPPLPENEVSEDTISIAAQNESSSFLIGIIIWSLIGIITTLILIFMLKGSKSPSPFTTKK